MSYKIQTYVENIDCTKLQATIEEYGIEVTEIPNSKTFFDIPEFIFTSSIEALTIMMEKHWDMGEMESNDLIEFVA